MSNLTPAQQRQQSNRTADGKYTTKQHSEAEVDLGLDAQPQRIDEFGHDWTEVFAEFEQPRRFKMEILTPHYDDEYSDDYIDAELSGNMERIWEVQEEEQHWEWHEQAVFEAIDYELQQRDIDLDDARGTELYDQLREVVHSSEHVIHPSETIRDNTSHKLLRMEVFEGENLTDANEDAYHDDEARFEVLQAKFTELGLDPNNDVNKAAIEEMVYQGPEYWHEGVSLDVIWSGHYKDAVPGVQDKTLEFKDPHLVLIDSFNGSGWDAEVSGTIKRTIGTAGEEELPRTKRAYLDNRAGGYGWGAIASPHQPAYDVEVTVVEPDAEHKPADA